MKWMPGKGLRKQNLQLINSVLSIFDSTSQMSRLIFCLVCTGVFLSGDVSSLKLPALSPLSPQKLLKNIDRVASDITVKILDKDLLGSGFIVQQQGREYVVVTNRHVLRAGEAPYRIQTPDGRVYLAQKVADSSTSDREYDIAVLKFKADAIYPTAKIGSSVFLEVGEPIFAAGFPYTELNRTSAAIFEASEANKSRGLALKPGRIAIVLNRALEEGYQIASTNDVKKGMSGGPLINSRGEVIGINGKHAYPLWESPEIYQDGSQPCPDLQELITRSSLAIPIETSIELTPQLESLKPSSEHLVRQSILTESKLVAKMQAQARATTQSCKNFIRKSVREEAASSPSNEK